MEDAAHGPAARPQPGASGEDGGRTAVGAAVDRAAGRLARRHVGVVVAAVVPGQKEPVVAVAGSTRKGAGDPPSTRHLFEIASLTKVFTGLLLARAHLDGVVRLDDPVVRHLPALRRIPPGFGAVTLEQLARHTSGLPRSPLPFLEDVPRQDPYSKVTQDRLLDALQQTRLSRSGQVRYSNVGPAVLGLALAHASLGGPDPGGLRAAFGRLLADRVATPLGLEDTVLLDDAEQRSRRVPGHRWRRTTSVPWKVDAMAPAVGLLSTAHDLVVLVRACLASVDAATSGGPDRRITEALALSLGCEQGSPAPRHAPLAWFVASHRGRSVHWHNGASGGCRSFLGLDLDRGVGVVILTNSFTVRGADLVGLDLVRQAADQTKSFQPPSR